MSDSTPSAEDWIKVWIEGQRTAVQQWLSRQATSSSAGTPPTMEALKQMAAFTEAFAGPAGPGAAILELWQGFTPAGKAGFPFSGDPAAMGPLREHQEDLKGLTHAYREYQRLSTEVQVVLAKVHSDALDLLARRGMEQAHAGTPITGFKALYDLWVECGEMTYARVAHSESYCRLQGDLCNATLRIRSFQQKLTEHWLRQLNLPTRSEVDTLHRRVQDLQRRLDGKAGPAAPADTKAPAKRRRASRKR